MIYTEIPTEDLYERIRRIPQIRIREIEKSEDKLGIWIFEHAKTDFDVWVFMDLLDLIGLERFVDLINLMDSWGILFEHCSDARVSYIFAQVNKFRDIVKAVFSAEEKYKYIKEKVADYRIEVEGFSYWYDDGKILFKLILPIAFHMGTLFDVAFPLTEEEYRYIGAVLISWDIKKSPYIQEYYLFPVVYEDERKKVAIVEHGIVEHGENVSGKVFDFFKLMGSKIEGEYIIDASQRELSAFLEFYKEILYKGKKLLVKKFLFDEEG